MICALCGGAVQRVSQGWLHKDFLRTGTMAWHIATPVTEEPTVFYAGDYPRPLGWDATEDMDA